MKRPAPSSLQLLSIPPRRAKPAKVDQVPSPNAPFMTATRLGLFPIDLPVNGDNKLAKRHEPV